MCLQYDRAILDFGNVTQSGVAASASESRIVIEWDVIRIENPLTLNNTVYWVSAGAEYNDENEVWVGQASFTTIDDDYVRL